jgi:hypothetical protein
MYCTSPQVHIPPPRQRPNYTNQAVVLRPYFSFFTPTYAQGEKARDNQRKLPPVI